MQVCVFAEPHQGASFASQLRHACAVEERGFAGWFRAEHLMPTYDGGGLPGPTDAWVTLAGLALQTRRLRLGTLVTPATFRQPGLLAVTVAQVDTMSGGRVELGLGGGWYAREHGAYGIPFPQYAAERLDRLAEQLAIVNGLWATPLGESFSFAGRHYRLRECPALPKPTQQPGPPVILGGRGPRRGPILAAGYADEYNAPFLSVRDTAAQYERVRGACVAAGRDLVRRPLAMSVALSIATGSKRSDVRLRAALLERPTTLPPEAAVIGTPTQVTEQLGRYAELGVQRVYLRLPDPDDLHHLDLIADHILPHLRQLGAPHPTERYPAQALCTATAGLGGVDEPAG